MNKYEVIRIPLTKKQVKLLKKQNDQLFEMIFNRESDGKAGAVLAQIHPSLGFLECVVIDYKTGQKILKATKKYKTSMEEAKP